jgi:hypothetical protein
MKGCVMTVKGSRRSAAETPVKPVEPVQEVVQEVVVQEAVVAPVQEVVTKAIQAQDWIISYPLNDLYAVGITLPNVNFESQVVLFDRNGGQLPLATMATSNLTETDILRGSKRLVSAILNNLARSTTLI